MTKELEALNELRENLDFEGCLDFINEKRITDIKSALERLEAIDNANPSEALKDLKELHELAYGSEGWKIEQIVQSSHIKQALIKSQEQEKVLEIIKEKLVDMFKLYNCKSVEEYNDSQYKDCRLTQDEFDLLKRWLDE